MPEVATCLNISEDHMDRYASIRFITCPRTEFAARGSRVNPHDALSRPLSPSSCPVDLLRFGQAGFKRFGLEEKRRVSCSSI
jgi:UDP-N-acetylmuramoylalanine--D-glutamate ligase